MAVGIVKKYRRFQELKIEKREKAAAIFLSQFWARQQEFSRRDERGGGGCWRLMLGSYLRKSIRKRSKVVDLNGYKKNETRKVENFMTKEWS